MRAFKTEEILDTIEREEITEMTGVPAMYSHDPSVPDPGSAGPDHPALLRPMAGPRLPSRSSKR